jgi:hypothetical protein
MTDYLSTYVEELRRQPPELETSNLPIEPEQLSGYQRTLKVVEAPEIAQQAYVSVEEVRDIIWQEMMSYAQLVRPQHLLLIKAVPGVGKTTAAVRLAEELVGQGRRVLYTAPRHDFIHDLRAIAKQPYMIYEWLPRREGNDHNAETCRHTDEINHWLHRGYDGIDFCSRVCGWDYLNRLCPYHAQKRRQEPIVMGQHQHITAGHPLAFDFVIGDESPLASFQHQWLIPARWIIPPSMDWAEPLTELLQEIRLLAEQYSRIEGPPLLRALGGAQRVLEACQMFTMPTSAVVYLPSLHSASDAERAPYFHLPKLVPLLVREAEAEQAGREYPHRIIIDNGHLMLLLRREVNEQLPGHVVWLDATGNEHLYQAVFRRPVKVVNPPVRLRGKMIQITDRANGKSSLVQDGEITSKANQLTEQIRYIIKSQALCKPGIVSFQEFVTLDEFEQFQSLHFYAARGTNVQQGVDGHVVAGTPQPSILEMDKLVRMLFFERMSPFNRQWRVKEQPYCYIDAEGKGRAYAVSGFWHDEDLQAILWQYREAELIQGVHRSRLATRDVRVWLLSNLPIWELPPTELLQIRDLFEAPQGVDAFRWPEVLRVANEFCDKQGYVTSADLAVALSLDSRTARKYVEQLATQPNWDNAAVRTGRGRPPKAVQRQATSSPAHTHK